MRKDRFQLDTPVAHVILLPVTPKQRMAALLSLPREVASGQSYTPAYLVGCRTLDGSGLAIDSTGRFRLVDLMVTDGEAPARVDRDSIPPTSSPEARRRRVPRTRGLASVASA